MADDHHPREQRGHEDNSAAAQVARRRPKLMRLPPIPPRSP